MSAGAPLHRSALPVSRRRAGSPHMMTLKPNWIFFPVTDGPMNSIDVYAQGNPIPRCARK